jgi:hypothetical protein
VRVATWSFGALAGTRRNTLALKVLKKVGGEPYRRFSAEASALQRIGLPAKFPGTGFDSTERLPSPTLGRFDTKWDFARSSYLGLRTPIGYGVPAAVVVNQPRRTRGYRANGVVPEIVYEARLRFGD